MAWLKFEQTKLRRHCGISKTDASRAWTGEDPMCGEKVIAKIKAAAGPERGATLYRAWKTERDKRQALAVDALAEAHAKATAPDDPAIKLAREREPIARLVSLCAGLLDDKIELLIDLAKSWQSSPRSQDTGT